MSLYRIDPLQDPRWQDFVLAHPRAAVFHTPGWLEALRRTYGYEPAVLATSAPGRELSNGVVFCRIHSRLTGRRLVSLPFSDHCEPLVDDREQLESLVSALKHDFEANKSRYVELRPVNLSPGILGVLEKSKTFFLHRLDLRPSLGELFRGFHRDCVQRCIRRAEREGLGYEQGRSERLLRVFYRLMLQTRRRQQLPPQPLAWFQNLVQAMGDNLAIHLASKGCQPVASILTLRHKGTLTYKYGCSDKRFSALGGTQLLMWNAIQDARKAGLVEFDLGRTDLDNPGLIAFKDRWGATRSPLVYLRYPAGHSKPASHGLAARLARQVFSIAPDCVLTAAGRVLYRHFA